MGGGVLKATLLPDVDWSVTPALDGRAMLFTLVATVVTGVLAGLAPALQASRPNVTRALKEGGRSGGSARTRTRTVLLVFQVALSAVLLVGAGLFMRNLQALRGLDWGYDSDRLVFVSADLRGAGATDEQPRQIMRSLLERIRATPGVSHASFTLTVPFTYNTFDGISVPGIDSVSRLGSFALNAVSEDYFATTGTRILRGRPIEVTDGPTAPLVEVVSESMARRLWPDGEPLGRCIKLGTESAPCRTVVGIAQDIRRGDVRDDVMLQHYVPYEQYARGYAMGDWYVNGIFARVEGDVSAAVAPMRQELQRLVPALGFVRVVPLRERVEPQVQPWRLGTTMLGTFGGLGVLIAALGLFSAISYEVSQRTHEFGIRVALGARPRDIIRMVVRHGALVAVGGVMLGGLVALAGARQLAPLLLRTGPGDPVTYTAVGIGLIVIAAMASLLPARRAGTSDPLTALKSE